MAKLFLWRIFSTILWFEIISFIPRYDCEKGETSTAVGSVAVPPTYDPTCPLEVTSNLREFPPESKKAIKLQSKLNYKKKPFWPSQWIMTEETFMVNEKIYTPSMEIATMHKDGYKGVNVNVVIIGNNEVNCQHELMKGRCKNETKKQSRFRGWGGQKKSNNCEVKSWASAAAGIIGMADATDGGGVGVAPHCNIRNVVIDPNSVSGSPEDCANNVLKNTDKSMVPPLLFVHAWTAMEFNYEEEIVFRWGSVNTMDYSSKNKVLNPHVMGSGDHGKFANSCQCNQYTSTDSSFVFGSVGYDGFLTMYSETCASLIGVTYSTSMGNQFFNNIITISNSNNGITNAPRETTMVSAAIAGGIFALIFDYLKRKYQKVPSVTDLTFILALSANTEPLENTNILWFSNAAGLKYSPQAGFGLPDMLKAKNLMDNWIFMENPRIIEFSHWDKLSRRRLTYANSMQCKFNIRSQYSKLYIQSVTVEISAKVAVKRGSWSIYLISPSGTVSCLLEGRPFDNSKKNYDRLLLRSTHFLGEGVGGEWSIEFFTYKEESQPVASQQTSPSQKVPAAKPNKSRSTPKETKSKVTGFKIKFLCVETLPRLMNTMLRPKASDKDLEIMKKWVDFTHYQYSRQKSFNEYDLSQMYLYRNKFIKEIKQQPSANERLSVRSEREGENSDPVDP